VNLNNQVLSSRVAPYLEPNTIGQVDLLCIASPGIEESVGAACARWLVRVQLPTGWVITTGPHSLTI